MKTWRIVHTMKDIKMRWVYNPSCKNSIKLYAIPEMDLLIQLQTFPDICLCMHIIIQSHELHVLYPISLTAVLHVGHFVPVLLSLQWEKHWHVHVNCYNIRIWLHCEQQHSYIYQMLLLLNLPIQCKNKYFKIAHW